MEIDYEILKSYLKNVYFINGTACAGKSTACKAISERYDLILAGENYRFNHFLSLTTEQSHPHMNYFNTMSGFEAFVTRSKEEYDAWIQGVSYEIAPFEIIELISLSRNQKVIVDTNIPHSILSQIANKDQIVYMVATPEIAMEYFFERPDPEKQFLLKVIKESGDPIGNLKRYKESIAYINRQEVIDQFKNSGMFVVERNRVEEDIEEKIELIAKHFKLEQ